MSTTSLAQLLPVPPRAVPRAQRTASDRSAATFRLPDAGSAPAAQPARVGGPVGRDAKADKSADRTSGPGARDASATAPAVADTAKAATSASARPATTDVATARTPPTIATPGDGDPSSPAAIPVPTLPPPAPDPTGLASEPSVGSVDTEALVAPEADGTAAPAEPPIAEFAATPGGPALPAPSVPLAATPAAATPPTPASVAQALPKPAGAVAATSPRPGTTAKPTGGARVGGSAQATATDDTADPALPQPLLAATPPSTAASDGTVEPIGPGAKPPSDGPAEAVTASPIATTDDISAQALGAVQPALTGATPPTRVAGDDGPAKAADDEDAADTKAPDGDAKPSDAAPAGAPVVIAPPAPVSLPIDAGVPAAIGPKAGAAAGAGSAARPASPTAAPSPGPGRIETETSAGAETAPGVSGTSANPGRRGQAAAGGAETSRPETAFQHVFQEVAGVAAPDLQAAIPAPATPLLAHVASTAGPAAASQPAPVTVHGVAIAEVPVEIGLKSLAGVNHFEIRLTPEGLGRIDVRLDIADDGRVNANLLVDQPDTLRFLQRDANHLERALEQAGLKSDGGIAMTLRDPGSQGQQQGQSGQGAGGRQERGSPTSARDPAEPAERPRWQQLSWTRASGIDRSI